MRLGDFRRETANLPDDCILDDVMFVMYMPGYYDGYPNEIKDHNIIYTNEEKIRFYMFDSRSHFWEYCDADDTYEENLEVFLLRIVRGVNVSDDRWNSYIEVLKKQFKTYWEDPEWQEYCGKITNE